MTTRTCRSSTTNREVTSVTGRSSSLVPCTCECHSPQRRRALRPDGPVDYGTYGRPYVVPQLLRTTVHCISTVAVAPLRTTAVPSTRPSVPLVYCGSTRTLRHGTLFPSSAHDTAYSRVTCTWLLAYTATRQRVDTCTCTDVRVRTTGTGESPVRRARPGREARARVRHARPLTYGPRSERHFLSPCTLCAGFPNLPEGGVKLVSRPGTWSAE